MSHTPDNDGFPTPTAESVKTADDVRFSLKATEPSRVPGIDPPVIPGPVGSATRAPSNTMSDPSDSNNIGSPAKAAEVDPSSANPASVDLSLATDDASKAKASEVASSETNPAKDDASKAAPAETPPNVATKTPTASNKTQNESISEEDASAPASMSLFDHLAELRRRLIYCLICVFALTMGAWNFAGWILDLVMGPVLSLLPADTSLYYTGLPDAFSITFKVSLWAGVVAGSPFCLYQLWAFMAPGLLPEEKAKVPHLTIMATTLFLAGTVFAYVVAFPMTFKFFLAFSSDAMRPLLTIDRYMSLVMGMILAFALSFQLPLILMFLSRLGVVSSDFLNRKRSYAIVIIFILAAVLTPPDIISQIILAGTLILLYELSVFLVRGQEKARKASLTAAEAAEAVEEAKEAN